MIEGKCPKCGKQYWGWSLLNPRNQSCIKCGAGLVIIEDGKKVITWYSPFTAEEYKFKSPYLTTPDTEKGKDATVKEKNNR
jgi:hypothetical protein